MRTYITKSLWLLGSSVVICCLIYPLAVWTIGQTFFPFTANGSMVNGPDGKPVGSLLIAQPFTKDEYFWPRPSAASYDGSASASSTLAASNYLLRDRVARMLGPIVKYASGAKKGQLVAPDIEAWFQQDRYQGNPHIVAQWADSHNELAQSWVTADPSHAQYITDWAKAHTCYRPLLLFNREGDCLVAKLRPGNVHSAEGWEELLVPEIERQQRRGKEVVFRAHAAFAKPELYEALEEGEVRYAIRLPSNDHLERYVAELLTRPDFASFGLSLPPREGRQCEKS